MESRNSGGLALKETLHADCRMGFWHYYHFGGCLAVALSEPIWARIRASHKSGICFRRHLRYLGSLHFSWAQHFAPIDFLIGKAAGSHPGPLGD